MKQTIGICDWGIGGIGLYQKLLAHSNISCNIIYFSDAGYTPYGKVPEKELQERWQKVKRFFNEKGVTKIAVACNAFGSVIHDSEKENLITVIDAGVALVKSLNVNEIGITGGFQTIHSKIYEKEFEKMNIKTKSSIGQVLSARVEAGDLDSMETQNDILQVFDALENCNNILLACTHYPVLIPQIKTLFPQINIHDPAEKMAELVIEKFGLNNKLAKESTISYYTSGNTKQMKESALKGFHHVIPTAQKIVL